MLNPVWQAAADRGVTFRAVGQEPGWMLEITRGVAIVLVTDYGMARSEYPYVPPIAEGGGRVYTLPGAETTIRVFAEPCSDVMSGEAFPERVVLSTPERAYLGCGRTL